METAATSFLVHGSHIATVKAKSVNCGNVRNADPTQKKKAPAFLRGPLFWIIENRLVAAFRCVHDHRVKDVAAYDVVRWFHRFWRGECGGLFSLFTARFDDNVVTASCDLLDVRRGTTGASRDQATHDDVLFETNQLVLLTLDRSLGQNACGFLERCGRDERTCLQRRLGDTQQDRLASRGTIP